MEISGNKMNNKAVIENNVFVRLKTNMETVYIPDGVTSIGRNAFRDFKSLKQVHIPDGVTSIADCAFYGCSSLTQVNIPNSVTSIGNWAFYGCKALTVHIPDSVKHSENLAFFGCKAVIKHTPTEEPNAIEQKVHSGAEPVIKVKLDKHENDYTLLYKYRLYYGDNKSIYYSVDFNKKFNTDCIFVQYVTGISCDKIDLFEANFSGSYAFAIVDYKKQISYEYFDVFGEMVNKYIVTDKFENEINITPVNGIIIVSILGRNKTEADYDYFNEIIVNACLHTEAYDDDDDNKADLMSLHTKAYDDDEDDVMSLPPCMR